MPPWNPRRCLAPSRDSFFGLASKNESCHVNCPITIHLSYGNNTLIWHELWNPDSFMIPIMAYCYSPCITGQYNPLYTTNNHSLVTAHFHRSLETLNLPPVWYIYVVCCILVHCQWVFSFSLYATYHEACRMLRPGERGKLAFKIFCLRLWACPQKKTWPQLRTGKSRQNFLTRIPSGSLR